MVNVSYVLELLLRSMKCQTGNHSGDLPINSFILVHIQRCKGARDKDEHKV